MGSEDSRSPDFFDNVFVISVIFKYSVCKFKRGLKRSVRENLRPAPPARSSDWWACRQGNDADCRNGDLKVDPSSDPIFANNILPVFYFLFTAGGKEGLDSRRDRPQEPFTFCSPLLGSVGLRFR